MMGKDCERIVKSIELLEDKLSEALLSISSLNTPPIVIDGSHTHGDDGESSKLEFLEKDTPVDLSGYLSGVTSALSSISSDLSKVEKLGNELYVNTSSFNNSVGSPWKECNRLKSSVDSILSYSQSDYVGNRSEVISLINIARLKCFDAKWALIFYHDYLQRGFDAKFNDKLPSVVFKNADKKDTIGNIDQDFEENVNVPRPSLDPF